MNLFDMKLREHGAGELRRERVEIVQINVGKLCNMTCVHCHVNAGPGRDEIMTRETLERIVDWLAATGIRIVDITGGAPEMMPDFRYFVERLKAMSPSRHVMDRCNLTILLEPGHEDLGGFLARHGVELIASMPCYSPDNVDAQRGHGAFDRSIKALQLLNAQGYGRVPHLPLHLVYNPVGAFLPGSQEALEADYKRELKARFGVVFDRLYTIANMPIARFAVWLRHHGEYERYLQLLVENFNPAAVAGLMCRQTLSVGWRGEVYDCDFNQQLDLQWRENGRDGRDVFLWDLDPALIENRPVLTGEHCLGCTAGAGSTCGGAIVKARRPEEFAGETAPC